MGYLGNQLHADGFGFGIYSSAGTKTVRKSPILRCGSQSFVFCFTILSDTVPYLATRIVCWLPWQFRL
jgi:predicted glutamine amidotransferase